MHSDPKHGTNRRPFSDPFDQLPETRARLLDANVPTATETAVTVARPDSYFSHEPTQQLMVFVRGLQLVRARWVLP